MERETHYIGENEYLRLKKKAAFDRNNFHNEINAIFDCFLCYFQKSIEH